MSAWPQPPPRLLHRPVSPPTPAPSPQPTLLHKHIPPSSLPASPPRTHNHIPLNNHSPPEHNPHSPLLRAFDALPAPARARFLSSLLSALDLSELTALSAAILPRLKRDFLRELPIEIALHILSFLDDTRSLVRASRVSRFWRALINDEATWKAMCSRRGFAQSSPFFLPHIPHPDHPSPRLGFLPFPPPPTSHRPGHLLAPLASLALHPNLPLSSIPPHPDPSLLPPSPSRPNSFNSNLLSPCPRLPPAPSDPPASTLHQLPPPQPHPPEDLHPQDHHHAPIQRPLRVICSHSPQPGMVAPTDPSPSSGFRPPSMSMLGLSLNLSRSLSASYPSHHSSSTYPPSPAFPPILTQSPTPCPPPASLGTSSDIPCPGLPPLIASPTDAFPLAPPSIPSSKFSYKNYFKQAYLTESNWLRGPGELLSKQISQNIDGNEWVVTSLGLDDDWIIIGMATNKIHVFSAITGTFVRTLVGHELGVWCLALVSKGGVRHPWDVREKDPKGKALGGTEEEDDELVEIDQATGLHAMTSGDLSGSTTATCEWVPSTPQPLVHAASMMRINGGLGLSASAWNRTRPDNGRALGTFSIPSTSTGSSVLSSSIFQPVTSLGQVPVSNLSGSSSSCPTNPPSTSSPVHLPPLNAQNSTPQRNPQPRSSTSTPSKAEPRPTPRRPSSFSSFLPTNQLFGISADQRNQQSSANARANHGGMGLGAGGPSAGNLQQASACGVARGWGQSRSIVVSGGCDRDVRVWDVLTGKCKFVLHGHSSTIRCLKVLDGRPIAVSGSRDSSLRVWDIELGVQKHVLMGHSLSVRAIEVHGNRVVSGSYDTTCRLWDVDTGECLKVLRGHYHQIYAVAFDGKRIASGSMDSTVCIWSAETGELLGLLQGHTALVGQVQMMEHPDGNVLVTGGSDGRVVIFGLDKFECLHRLCAHDNSVTCLQFDQRFVVTGGNDGRVKLWDFKTGQFIRELSEPCEAVWRIVLRDDKAVLLCKRKGRTVMEVISFRPHLDT